MTYEVRRQNAVGGGRTGWVSIASFSGSTTRYDPEEDAGWQYDRPCYAWVEYQVVAVDTARNRSEQAFEYVEFEYECVD